MDTDGSGTVELAEFRRAVRNLGLTQYSDADLEVVFKHLDADGSGAVSYAELKARLMPMTVVKQLHKLRASNQLRRRARKLGSLGRIDFSPGAEPVQEQLAKLLKTNLMRLTDLLRLWDEDGNGSVDRREFAEAIAALGCDAPRSETDALFASFDADGSGQVDYREIQAQLHGR